MKSQTLGIVFVLIFFSVVTSSTLIGLISQKEEGSLKEFSLITPEEMTLAFPRGKINDEDTKHVREEIPLSSRGNMGAYHTYEEVIAEIDQLITSHPNITHKQTIGQSIEGRDLILLKISDNPAIDEDEPEVFYMSQIHAREAISTEVVLGIIHHLTDKYGTDSEITQLVDSRELWFLPVANPDGAVYVANEDSSWRKNRRDNGDGTFGVDLNRNFGYEWGLDIGSSGDTGDETYRGTSAFSEPETQAIRDFILAHDFVASIAYHSYSNLILYPWGYTSSACPEKELFKSIGNQMAGRQPYESYTVVQGSGLYPTSGDSDDWLYGELGVYAFTIEIYEGGTGSTFNQFNPPENQISYHVNNNIPPALYLASIADNPSQVLDFQCVITAPKNEATISEDVTRVIINATKGAGVNDRTVTKAEIKIDSTGPWLDITLNDLGNNSWYYDWIVTLSSGGSHTLHARITNDLNQTTYASSITVNVIDFPPEIANITLSPLPVTTSTNLSVIFHVKDDRGLVPAQSKVYYKDFLRFYEVNATLLNGTEKSGYWQAFIPLSLGSSAIGRILEIKPSITDTGGNTVSGPSKYTRIIGPGQPYVFNLIYLPHNVTTATPISIEFAVLDDGGVVSATVHYKDLVNWFAVTADQINGTTTENWWHAVIPALSDSGGRVLQIKASATDNEGNVGESEIVQITVEGASLPASGLEFILVGIVCFLLSGFRIRKRKNY